MASITQDIKYSLLTSIYPFVIINTIYIKVREDHRVVSKALMIALGIDRSGMKEIIEFDVCSNESENTWVAFLGGLKD